MDFGVSSRRSFFGKFAGLAALASGASKLFAQQSPAPAPGAAPAGEPAPGMPRGSRGGNHVHDGIYYFSGTGSNDGYPKGDHVLVTDPYEMHVKRTMDALKKSLERQGCTMDSIIHLTVFFCLPIADGVAPLSGQAKFDAYKAKYDGLNKIYATYFSPGKAPSRACMALEWIPGDSLVEMVGSALVVNPPAAAPAND